MKNVLFIGDKWHSGTPFFGLSNNHHNIFFSFLKSQPNYQLHTLHFDESYGLYGVHINQILVQYCWRCKIDLIILTFLGDSSLNPSLEVLKEAKNLGIKIVCIFPDSNPLDLVRQNNYNAVLDICVTLDGREESNNKTLNLWCPQSSFLYYPDKQDIKYSFCGAARRSDRQLLIQEIKNKLPDFHTFGGQVEEGLSAEKYASFIRRSQIGVNLCDHPMITQKQLKGRIFEIIGSKSLLMEKQNDKIYKYFTPGEDYIEWENIDDLADKLKYYHENEKERLRIAENGYNKFSNSYTEKHFWGRVMEKLDSLAI